MVQVLLVFKFFFGGGEWGERVNDSNVSKICIYFVLFFIFIGWWGRHNGYR